MRVLVLTNQWPRASQPYCGIVVVRQIESLRRAGIEAEVIAIDGSLRSYVRAALRVLALNVRPRRGDVLHAHTGHSGLLACLQLRYPVVLTYVGYDVDDQLEERGRARRVLERAAFRPLSAMFAASIVKSARSVERLPRLGRRRVSVIPNGIDRRLFSPAPPAQARRRLGWGPQPTVLFAADPQRQVKRFALASQAVELARSSVPDLRLVVADKVPPEEMVLWMSAADVLLLTSISEGSPNVVKEAMACNLPVVSVDVGDVSEVITDTRHCRVCSDDPHDLERGVRDVIAALPERSDGREHTAWLDDGAVAARVADVYRSARRRAPGILGCLPARRRSSRATAQR